MAPMEADGELPTATLQRKQAIYKSKDEGFLLGAPTYKGQQYSQLYFARLHVLRELLRSLAKKWKPHLSVQNILGLEEGKDCIIIGTLYKQMKLKPSVLDEYSKERSSVPLVKPHNFMHPDDHLILEDERGRVKLAGSALPPSEFVTGVVVALHGKEISDGTFLVEDVLEAGLPAQTKLPLEPREDKYVVFVSGLSMGSRLSNPLQYQLLVDHLTGHLGGGNEQSMASQIVHVVITGNSVELQQGLLAGQALGPKDQNKLYEPIKELDLMLTQLASSVPVDIMPGASDPANFSLPQQPLHRFLFSGASSFNTFLSSTNPHRFILDDILFLGTSGQNIDDLEKYSDAKDKLEFLERTLRWRHLAPTAPDTLGCYPFTDGDPFVIDGCPHVYFVGNQSRYESRILKGSEGQVVRLICIPRFCETGVAVLLNLRDLECYPLQIVCNIS
ncbi:DNA polymerase delta small subunit [Nymphaea colorata]|nr:DNA polymerase delta small subunit [Nymphaea colorata]